MKLRTFEARIEAITARPAALPKPDALQGPLNRFSAAAAHALRAVQNGRR